LELGSAFLQLTWITKELGDLIWEHTGGNPLLIRLLTEHLYEQGRIAVRREDGLGDLAGDGHVPALKEIVVERIERLPTEQLKTLLNAVILGDGFRLGALGALHEGRHETDLVADLDVLVQAGLLEQSGSGRRTIFRFPHALIRDTLYESAPPDRRAYLHSRAGDYYTLPVAGRKLRFESAVYHYLRAGKPEKAMSVIDMGLQRAQEAADQDEMIALYRAGLKIAASVPEMGAHQSELAEALGDVFAANGDYKQAAAAYRQIDTESSSLDQQGKLGLAMLAVNPMQATGLLLRLAGEIPLDYPNDLRWRIEAGLAWGLALVGRTYEAVRHSRDSLGTLSSTAGFGSARTLMRGTLGMALHYHGDQAEAAPHLESARAGYSARGDERGVMFINQILIGMPRADITQAWLDLVLRPLVRRSPADMSPS
jgi:tetratricopeptide (TPR) repeat protein